MQPYEWEDGFRPCYDKAVKLYAAGNRKPADYFTETERSFLATIGATAQELYDFAEDWCASKEPTYGTALLIAAARRDFFLVVQKGQWSPRVVKQEELPAKEAAVAGFPWLPRIIAKARARLRGELTPEIMYACGGDRRFLKSVKIHPADFLRTIWSVRDDDQKIIEYVKQQAQTRA